MCDRSRRMLMKARAGTTRPHRKNRERLAAIVRELGLLEKLEIRQGTSEAAVRRGVNERMM